LVGNLGMRGLVVGPDFALGRNRSGDIATLNRLGNELGFAVHVVDPVVSAGQHARSSLVRDLLIAGRVEDAARLLGRPYTISGDVRLGDQRGRTIGVPTANVAPPADKLLPADGVYATIAHLCTPQRAYSFASVTNIGVRPTVDGFHHRVEAHLLNFPPSELPDNLYGQSLTLDVIARLRGEQRFSGLDALVAQIRADIRRARDILNV
ncbi:MAG: riboflavin kinase, partial [Caldilineaceae bacterium]